MCEQLSASSRSCLIPQVHQVIIFHCTVVDQDQLPQRQALELRQDLRVQVDVGKLQLCQLHVPPKHTTATFDQTFAEHSRVKLERAERLQSLQRKHASVQSQVAQRGHSSDVLHGLGCQRHP